MFEQDFIQSNFILYSDKNLVVNKHNLVFYIREPISEKSSLLT